MIRQNVSKSPAARNWIPALINGDRIQSLRKQRGNNVDLELIFMDVGDLCKNRQGSTNLHFGIKLSIRSREGSGHFLFLLVFLTIEKMWIGKVRNLDF